ncbi:MAG: exodeoxyribonuclease VII large subunit [Eubacterium sp.]|nr:exodeoxyribonuclease VII large subunit [Eubacterium sp.]
MMKRIYSVGQVNTYIKNMFAQDFLLHKICVKGEISNCKYHSSGHIYFSLKDATGTIAAVMFAGNRKNGLKFQMRDGDHVVAAGSVEVYERDGRYQLYAREITLDGAGALFLRFEALKKELEEMGMFAPEYKRPIPKYIRTLGVVTAPTGAAVQDIRNISRRRNPYVQLILYPAQVQGDGAAQSIVNGIRALERLGVDTIIVGRGGGSIEDLWAFNEEIVARAIFECSVPIISAVGHETDTTIADFVSDLRAPTPSAAAELAVYDISQFYESVRIIRTALQLRMREHIRLERQKQEQLKLRLSYLSPQTILNNKKQYVAELESVLGRLMEYRLQDRRHRIQLLAGRLEAGSPIKKMSQGFSFVTDPSGRPLTECAQVRPGEEIDVRTLDGKIHAQVLEVERYGKE